TAGQSPIFSDEPRTLEALFSPGFDPRHSVYLPLEARDEIHATQSSARAVLTHFSAHELRRSLGFGADCGRPVVLSSLARLRGWSTLDSLARQLRVSSCRGSRRQTSGPPGLCGPRIPIRLRRLRSIAARLRHSLAPVAARSGPGAAAMN